ncbi:STAS domain-containing protein [Paenisporosarcina quisquiliarum]|uniref:STAS domain-containing protein n=1 Tax=Paenisporosarcina quisquiliarum TaxID=365346 RepID=A0A9X3RDE0_9BACL|nr:STAS domain-containing protein [Paenisporosarcina quisquiliarum]MCZ8537451.1 STAS domain-containing protein [Paenisporosarcina quisquiliarum]
MNLSSHLMHMKDFILAQSKELASVITNEQNARYPELQRVEQDLFPLRIELVELYGACLGMSEDQRVLVLKEWGEKAGSSTARMQQITIDMMLREVPHYRNTIGSLIKYEAQKLELTANELYDVIDVLDRSINDVVYFFSVPFVRHDKEQLAFSQQMVVELSVPVVSITDEIAVLPLIGTMNEERSRVLHERALTEASRLQIKHLIIDLSGVQTIDTFVAQQLFNLLDSLALLGVKGTVSGISPIIAQTLVHLGLDFGRIGSYASLKRALAVIQSS